MTEHTPQLFTPLANRIRPKPSTIYPVLWQFACERHRVYLRRVAGDAYPWTSDSVLLEYKFTNAFRAADRVSQYLIRLICSDREASVADVVLENPLVQDLQQNRNMGKGSRWTWRARR